MKIHFVQDQEVVLLDTEIGKLCASVHHDPETPAVWLSVNGKPLVQLEQDFSSHNHIVRAWTESAHDNSEDCVSRIDLKVNPGYGFEGHTVAYIDSYGNHVHIECSILDEVRYEIKELLAQGVEEDKISIFPPKTALPPSEFI